jgi:cytochrome c biogenesis protein
MAQATLQPRLVRRSPAEVIVDRVWRFFCSVRAAVYEIVVLALLVLIGTLRGSSVPEGIATHIPATRGIVERWYDWDVFHSLAFIFMLTLISVAIAICTINRAPGIWRNIAHPTITTSQGFLRNADVNTSYQTSGTMQSTVESVTAAFNKRHYRVLTTERNDEVHLYADRYRYTKLGTFPFHLALILILVGGIVGARYGFREAEFIVPEGSIVPVGHNSGLSIGLTDFRDTYRDNGSPQEYRSDLVLYKNGEPVKEGSITVNHPMSYESVTLYQTSFGQAVSLRITDDQGRLVYDDSIPMGIFQSRLNPDAPAGVLELLPYNLSIHVIAPDNNPNNMPELDTLGLRSGEMFIQVRPNDLPAGTMPPSAKVGQGETVNLEGLNIQFVRERQFTLLQVANNPGMPIFWTAAFMLVGGLAIVFYFPHRRIRGIIAPEANGQGVAALFAPLAKRDWSGKQEFRRICEEIDLTLGVRGLVKERVASDDDGSDNEQPAGVQPVSA